MRKQYQSMLLFSLLSIPGTVSAVTLTADTETKFSNYQLVIADEPTVEIHTAAWELATFLTQVTGAKFSIVPASRVETDHRIIVGRNKALGDLDSKIDWDALGPDGYVIRTVGKTLIIAGGPRRGTINAAYTFLEDIVGCRWYTPHFSVIPSRETVSIKKLNVQHVPVFEARFVNGGPSTDVDWSVRRRMNRFTGDVGFGSSHAEKRASWRRFMYNPKVAGSYYSAVWQVHTLGHSLLVPASEFDRNPEYFALIDGKRTKGGQPCLSHPELVNFITGQAIEWLKLDPGADIIAISQGDFYSACQCEACTSNYETFGPSGAMLRFVNAVAAKLEIHKPGILVSTLAYQWTLEPPKNVTPRKNVIIRYAPIRACSHHAYDECDFNKEREIYDYLEEWVRISERVWVWSYALPSHDFHPYPAINALSRNFKRMRDAGVKGHFVQTAIRHTMTGGLIDLTSYLITKLMWDPDYVVEQGIKEFSEALYGEAAAQFIAYVEMVNDPDTYDVNRHRP
jgi:hypothetical protein